MSLIFGGCLFAYFDQLIDGIPVLSYGYQGYADYKSNVMRNETQGQLGGICITQGLHDIGSDELYRSLQLQLISAADLIAEDVPLCGLDTIIQTAEALINAGQLRIVDPLWLGYVVWLDKKHTYRSLPESYNKNTCAYSRTLAQVLFHQIELPRSIFMNLSASMIPMILSTI